MLKLSEWLKYKENFHTKPKTWLQHLEKWGHCKACPLSVHRKQVVLARGTLPCDVLFIGEAPGYSENVTGRPFNGPAGALLDQMILAAGLHSFEVVNALGESHFMTFAFTNLVACMPKDNFGKIRPPDDEEIKTCAPRLEEFIILANPKIIVRVGRLAQKWIDANNSSGILTISIDHPATILREPQQNRGLAIQRNIDALRDYLGEI